MTERLAARHRMLPEIDEVGETYCRLPFSDFQRWTKEGDIYERAFTNLPLGRLDGIRSLSFLSSHNKLEEIIDHYKQSRFEHVFLVSLLLGDILRRNGFSKEKVVLAELAGLLHDIGTPAFGDAAKKIDPKALNEEKFWWDCLDKTAKSFLRKHGGFKKDLDGIIKNRGLNGQALDIVDRIVYTMIDLRSISEKLGGPLLSPDLIFIKNFVGSNQKIGNIYKEVGIDQKRNEVFFKNPQSLAKFLLIRAVLHKDLYMNPISLGRDLFIAKLISPLYSRSGNSLLTPAKLRLLQDHKLFILLFNNLHERFGDAISDQTPSYMLDYHLINWRPKYERCDSLKHANAKAIKLSRKKGIFVVGVDECRGFNPATSYKIATSKGKILPFRDFMSEKAREIEQIAESTKGIFVFYSDLSKDNPINSLLESILMSKKGNK